MARKQRKTEAHKLVGEFHKKIGAAQFENMSMRKAITFAEQLVDEAFEIPSSGFSPKEIDSIQADLVLFENKLTLLIHYFYSDEALLARLFYLTERLHFLQNRFSSSPALSESAGSEESEAAEDIEKKESEESEKSDETEGLESSSDDSPAPLAVHSCSGHTCCSSSSSSSSSSSGSCLTESDSGSEDEEQDEPLETPFDCPVCFSQYTMRSEVSTFSQCSHTYCKGCLEAYYKTAMSTGNILHLTCPFPGCSTRITASHVEVVFEDQSLVSKFERLSLVAALNADPSCCWCPFPDCGNPMITSEDDELRVFCNSCFRSFCRSCCVPWHTQMNCKEHQEASKPLDPKTDKWIKKHGIKNCPNCGMGTSRISGCSDIRCTNCLHDWNWDAGKDYDQETLLERVSFYYPRTLKVLLGSREFKAAYEENPKRTVVDYAAPTLIYSAVGVPLFATTCLPAYLVRKVRQRKNPKTTSS